MVKNNRSLNLSNSVGIVIYEAWRQLEFENWKLNFRFSCFIGRSINSNTASFADFFSKKNIIYLVE